MKYATGLIGAVTGGIAGNVIQEKLTSQQAVEYTIKLGQQDFGDIFIKTTGYKSSLQKSTTNRYVTVIQAQGVQVINVGQKLMIAGINSKLWELTIIKVVIDEKCEHKHHMIQCTKSEKGL